VTNPPNGQNPFSPGNNGFQGPDDYDSGEPRDHRRRKRGVAGPIIGALAVLTLLVGGGWYVTRDTKDSVATSQNDPLTSVTDEVTTPPVDDSTPTSTPTVTPSKTPSKTPSATPTPTRTSTAPSRNSTRTPKPTPKPTHTSTPTKPTTKPPAPSGSKEAQVLQLTNNERAKAGCGPLRTNSALTRAADAHATDMVVHHFFDHNSQDGRSPFDRMKAAGFKGGAMAENIAVGYSSAAAVVDGWMHSEGHRRNILNCTYTMIGIGYDSGQVKPDWGNGSWVQDFGG
jgi:uncharacterized protein YkwD